MQPSAEKATAKSFLSQWRFFLSAQTLAQGLNIQILNFHLYNSLSKYAYLLRCAYFFIQRANTKTERSKKGTAKKWKTIR